jgi:hypothetical protein
VIVRRQVRIKHTFSISDFMLMFNSRDLSLIEKYKIPFIGRRLEEICLAVTISIATVKFIDHKMRIYSRPKRAERALRRWRNKFQKDFPTAFRALFEYGCCSSRHTKIFQPRIYRVCSVTYIVTSDPRRILDMGAFIKINLRLFILTSLTFFLFICFLLFQINVLLSFFD